MPLGDHLGADQDPAGGLLKGPQDRRRRRRRRRRPRRRRGGTPGRRRRRRSPTISCARRSVPAPWRATAEEEHCVQRAGTSSRCPQWWQERNEPARCSTSVTSHSGHFQTAPARAAGEEVRPPAPVEQHDRLAPGGAHVGERLHARPGAGRSGRSACRAPRRAAAGARRRAGAAC